MPLLSAQTSGKRVLGHQTLRYFELFTLISLSQSTWWGQSYLCVDESEHVTKWQGGETLFWGLLSELKQPARQAGTHTLTFLLSVYPDYSQIYRLKTRNEVVRTVWKSPVEPDEPLPTGPHQNQVHAKLSTDSEPPLDSRIIYADSGMFGLILVLSLCRTLALTFSSHVLRGRGAIGLSDQNGSYLGLGHHQMSVGGLCTCGWAWSWSMQTHCRPCGMRWNKWPQWSWNPETE